MSDNLKGKRILVAGAGGLLGSRIVKAILEERGKVIAVDYDINQTIENLKKLSVDIKCLDLESLDITSESDVISFFNRQSGLDGAVNATYPRNKNYGKHFFDVTMSSFNENVNLHLGSSFLFSQQCAAYFKRMQKEFSLVNISSIYGVIAPKFDIYEGTSMTMPVEYAAIKSAILHINKYIASYIKNSDFRVNAISPGGLYDGQPSPFLIAYKKETHGAGMLDVEEMLGSIIFLLSNHSRHITGQNIVIDDGFTL